MNKFLRDPDRLVLKIGLAAVLVVELYKFIKFIAS